MDVKPGWEFISKKNISFLYNKKSLQYNYLMLVLIAYVAIFSTVAILPRYKLIILPLQIIFTSVFIEKIKSYYLNLKKNK